MSAPGSVPCARRGTGRRGRLFRRARPAALALVACAALLCPGANRIPALGALALRQAAAQEAATPPAGAVWAEPDAAAPPSVEPRRPGVALLYFFSPDWRPPDLSKLAVAVEAALAAGGVDVSFQAFTRYEDFERQVMVNPPVFLIAPAWFESGMAGNLGLRLRAIAQPLRKGKSTYRKALMTRSNIDSIDDLARGSIAATLYSMGGGSPATVLEAFHLAADSARVVPVPKDVDALLALSFGQVDAALVTGEQYERLAQTNPAEAERLRVLAFSPEIKLPPVFSCSDKETALAERMKALLLRLREVPQGSNVLDLLGFDGFVSATAETTETQQAAAAPPNPVAKTARTAQNREAPRPREANPAYRPKPGPGR